MINSIVPLVVGFMLTAVLGGLLGTYLQQRSWKHQNDARLREEELRRADDVCHAVSQLLALIHHVAGHHPQIQGWIIGRSGRW
jgi:hypothetical protein